MSFPLGEECKLYRNTGTDAIPTWVELKNVKDLTNPISFGDAAVGARFSAWDFSRKARGKFEFNFNWQHQKGVDADFDALQAAALSPITEIQFAVADGAIATAGTRYIKAWCQVFSKDANQPLAETMTHDFTVKLTPHLETGVLKEPVAVTVP